MRVDPEHMEVVTASVSRYQQHAACVELQGDDRFRVRYEVSHNWVAGLFGVLTVFFLITLKINYVVFLGYLIGSMEFQDKSIREKRTKIVYCETTEY